MYGDYRLPEPSLEPPEPEIIGCCEHCREDICKGDEIVEFDGVQYHEDSFRDIAFGILRDRYGAMVCVAGEASW